MVSRELDERDLPSPWNTLRLKLDETAAPGAT
jgi:hypothetical protein